MRYLIAIFIVFTLVIPTIYLDAIASELPSVLKQDECPVVANTNSGIYHVPGGKYFNRMLVKNKGKDNRKCFKTEVEANKAGYRKSKV